MQPASAYVSCLLRPISYWVNRKQIILLNPINIKPDGIFYIIDIVKVKRNYIAIGLILGVALGIATRKLIIGLAIGLIIGFIINSLQNRDDH